MSALSGTPPTSLPGALHGVNMSHGNTGSNFNSSNPGAPGVLPSLSPPNNPAALLNGLISAAGAAPMGQGGFMAPTTGSNMSVNRDSDKFSAADEKQVN